MTLLKQLFEMAKKPEKIKIKNPVAKFNRNSGSGRHQDKVGKKAPRHRQKKQWRTEEGM